MKFMKSIVAFCLIVGLLSCADDQVVPCFPADCGLLATVVDYSELDGCDLLLELPGGTRLIPVRLTYVHAPTPEEDPIYHYDLKAGEQVYISYKPSKVATACMAGQAVFITCIKPATTE